MVDRYKVVVGNVTATAHGAAHPEGEYVLWRDYEALRAEVEAHKRSRQIDANEARSREMELRAEVERLRAMVAMGAEYIQDAINSGDWKVDGACDPDDWLQSALAFQRAAEPTLEPLLDGLSTRKERTSEAGAAYPDRLAVPNNGRLNRDAVPTEESLPEDR